MSTTSTDAAQPVSKPAAPGTAGDEVTDPVAFALGKPATVPLERFATAVIPAVRAAAPTTLWEAGDPYAGRPAATATDHANHRRNHVLSTAH